MVKNQDKVKAHTVARRQITQKPVAHVKYRDSRIPDTLILDFLCQNADKIQLFHFWEVSLIVLLNLLLCFVILYLIWKAVFLLLTVLFIVCCYCSMNTMYSLNISEDINIFFQVFFSSWVCFFFLGGRGSFPSFTLEMFSSNVLGCFFLKWDITKLIGTACDGVWLSVFYEMMLLDLY